MRYLLFICADGIPASDEEEALVEVAVSEFVAKHAEQEIFGHPLLGPETATTVRVRHGQPLVSDGPFVETKEHIAGFILIECETREQAIELAAEHPLAWFHKIEVRPCAEEYDDEWAPAVRQRLNRQPATGTGRYLMLVCVEPSPEQREEPAHTVDHWVQQHSTSGARIVGQVLDAPGSAATVRVRGPQTLITDGPFVEAKEFVAGFDVLECANLDEAVAVAARHPMAWSHMIEVRPFGLPHALAD